MKILMKSTVLLFAFLSIVSCKQVEGEKVNAEEATEIQETNASDSYAVSAAESLISWEGAKPTGTHTGTISVSEGKVSVENGAVVGGSFVIDMNSIVNTDLSGEQSEKLVGHLKSADFFEVETYPTAEFEISKVTELKNDSDANSLVYGNLTLKGVSKAISFKANIVHSENAVKVTAPQFVIDRSQWNVKYGSKSFFDDLKDNFINDEIGLSIGLIANK